MEEEFAEIPKEWDEYLQMESNERIIRYSSEFLKQNVSLDNYRTIPDQMTLLHKITKFPKQYPLLYTAKTENNTKLEIVFHSFFYFDHKDKYGNTPLHYVASNPNALPIFNKLLGLGTNILSINEEGLTPLEIIIKSNNYMFLKLIPLTNKGKFSEEVINLLKLSISYKSNDCIPSIIDACSIEDKKRIVEEEDILIDLIKTGNHEVFPYVCKLFSSAHKLRPDIIFNSQTVSDALQFTNVLLKEQITLKQFEELEPTDGIPQEVQQVIIDICDGAFNGRTLIHTAIINGNEQLLKKIPDYMIDSCDYNGSTPLFYAIKQDKLDFVKYLLKHGADPTISNSKTTPLHKSAKGKAEILRMILKYRKNINLEILDSNGHTPLIALFCTKKISRTNFDCIKMLIDAGANIHSTDNKGNNLLYYFIARDIAEENFDYFLELMEKGIPINTKSKNSPIITAFQQKKSLVKHILALYGEKIQIDQNEILSIIKKNKGENVECLIKKLQNYKSPAMIEFMFDSFKKVLEINNDASANDILHYFPEICSIVDENDNNILHIIACHPLASTYQFLSQVFVNLKDLAHINSDGETFIHVAINVRNSQLFELLCYIVYKFDELTNIEASKRIQNIYKPTADSIDMLQFVRDQPNGKEIIDQIQSILMCAKGNEFSTLIDYTIYCKFSIYTFFCDIFFQDVTCATIDMFLKSTKSPDAKSIHGKPLIIYVCEYFTDEDELCKAFEMFKSYHCNLCATYGERRAANIVVEKEFFSKAFQFLLDNGGVFYESGSFLECVPPKLKPKVMELMDNHKFNKYSLDIENFGKTVQSFIKRALFITNEHRKENQNSVNEEEIRAFEYYLQTTKLWRIIEPITQLKYILEHFYQRLMECLAYIEESYSILPKIIEKLSGFYNVYIDVAESILYQEHLEPGLFKSYQSIETQLSNFVDFMSKFQLQIEDFSKRYNGLFVEALNQWKSRAAILTQKIDSINIYLNCFIDMAEKPRSFNNYEFYGSTEIKNIYLPNNNWKAEGMIVWTDKTIIILSKAPLIFLFEDDMEYFFIHKENNIYLSIYTRIGLFKMEIDYSIDVEKLIKLQKSLECEPHGSVEYIYISCDKKVKSKKLVLHEEEEDSINLFADIINLKSSNSGNSIQKFRYVLK